MSTTTTNFGWTVPSDTDLVKDGAAAIRTALGGVDTSFVDLKGGTTGQVLSKASGTDLDYTWVTPEIGDITAVVAGTGLTGGGTTGSVTVSIDTATTVDLSTAQTLTNKTLTSPVLTTPSISTIDAKGDLLVGTADATIARLAVGTNDFVLTADSSTATGLKWAASGGGATAYSLINTGGTALTGSTTITVSGISGKNSLMILIVNGSSVNASTQMLVRFNSDTGSNYSTYGFQTYGRSTYSKDQWSMNSGTGTSLGLAVTGNSSSSVLSGYVFVDGANSTSPKVIQTISSGDQGGSSQDNYAMMLGGLYTGSSTISSVSIISSSGNWDAGTVYVYGA